MEIEIVQNLTTQRRSQAVNDDEYKRYIRIRCTKMYMFFTVESLEDGHTIKRTKTYVYQKKSLYNRHCHKADTI